MEIDSQGGTQNELMELVVPPDSPVIGNQIVNIGLPEGTLIILIAKGDDQFESVFLFYLVI